MNINWIVNGATLVALGVFVLGITQFVQEPIVPNVLLTIIAGVVGVVGVVTIAMFRFVLMILEDVLPNGDELESEEDVFSAADTRSIDVEGLNEDGDKQL